VDRSNVILDFVFDEGLLFVSVANIGNTPATDVVVELDQPIRTAEGIELGKMELFRQLLFLAPHKEIVAFVDSSAAYFERKGPAKVTASIRWKDQDGESRSATIHHDLSVYRELPYVPGRPRR
jgi:hypothetical protein